MNKSIPEAVLESVARAICMACEENPDHQGDARGNEFRWQDYRDAALAAISAFTAAQKPAEYGCHCGTCTCNPNMTPAVRFDLSPAQMEGAIRDHLIRLGWTPPEQRAEIEKLRAEVEAWRELSDHVHAGACKAIWPDRYIDERIRDVAAALKRAARMEEALALLPDEIVMVEHNPYEGPLMFCCGQRVTSGGLHDLLTNHSKECWYARMRALRDHDQENKA